MQLGEVSADELGVCEHSSVTPGTRQLLPKNGATAAWQIAGAGGTLTPKAEGELNLLLLSTAAMEVFVSKTT